MPGNYSLEDYFLGLWWSISSFWNRIGVENQESGEGIESETETELESEMETEFESETETEFEFHSCHTTTPGPSSYPNPTPEEEGRKQSFCRKAGMHGKLCSRS